MQPEWEKSKENVAPLREGRDTTKLESALKATKEQLDTAKASYEAAILDARNGKGPHADDPLAPCVDYAKWAVENYPAGSPVICTAVEKPCRRYGKNNRYKDDVRLARLWVRYADMRPDKLDAYQYMHRNGIGETAAIFYEAWAVTLERARDFDKAEWVYNLGREKRAQPAERLAQRQNEYFKRMTARAKRSEKKELEKQVKHMVKAQREEGRSSRAPGRERSSVADSLLASASTSIGSDPVDENGDPLAITKKELVRPALGTITDDEARSSHRPVAHSSNSHFAVKRQPKPVSNKMPEKLTVFSDKNEGPIMDENPVQKTNDEILKPMIASRADLSKEDDGQPMKWAGETLPQNPALKRRRADAVSAAPSFSIYQGDDDDGEPMQDTYSERAATEGNSSQVGLRSTKPSVLAIKSSGEAMSSADGSSSASDQINIPSQGRENSTLSVAAPRPHSPPHASNDRHDLKLPSSPTVNTKMALDTFDDTIANIRTSKTGHDIGRPSSPTINTRMAFEAVDGIFNDTRTMNYQLRRKPREHPKVAEKQSESDDGAGREPFVIFKDNDSNGTSQLPSGKSTTKSPNLEIFVDNEADKENAHGPRAPRSGVPGPSSIPALEQRVFQPLPELEHRESPVEDESRAYGSSPGKKIKLSMVVVKNEGQGKDVSENPAQESESPENKVEENNLGNKTQENVDEKSKAPGQSLQGNDTLIDFLCKWFKSHPSCQILKEDPEHLDGMFDLDPEHGDLLSLDPHCIHHGAEQKSLVILADDLNNIYNLKPAPEESDDELDDIDVDAEPCIAVKVSNPENLWEFYIYRTLEERIGVQQFGSSIPRALAFFEGRSKCFMILNRIGLSSLADAPSVFGGNGMPEVVCAFLLSDLLKTLESIHSAGIIHNDITLDNVLVRDSGVDFNSSGEMGEKGIIDLSKEGVLLVDFNCSVDTRHPIAKGNDAYALARYVAERGRSSFRSDYRANGCTEWAFNGDCYAAAVCAAKLLQVQVGEITSGGENLKYKSLWSNVIQRLCSLDSLADGNTTVSCMRECRAQLEHAIAKDNWLHRHYRDFILMTGLKRLSEN